MLRINSEISRFSPLTWLAAWSSGMIRPLGGRGPAFDSRSGPSSFVSFLSSLTTHAIVALLATRLLFLFHGFSLNRQFNPQSSSQNMTHCEFFQV